MNIRLIGNNDFLQLAIAYADMGREINPNGTDFSAVYTLTKTIHENPGFVAIGLYEDDELKGFVTGWGMTKNIFYFSGLHVIMKNNEWTKKIIDFAFAHIAELGFTAWEVDATNANVCSIMEKYGATVKYTRYHKEL